MCSNVVTIPNLLSVTRIAGLPVLYLVRDRIGVFVFLVLLLALTDALDGFLARKLKQASSFGAKLDTIADTVYYIFFAWMFWQRFSVEFVQSFFIRVMPVVLVAVSQGIMITRFRSLAFFHLYSMKATTAMLYLFVLTSLAYGFNSLLLDIFLLVWFVGSLEMVLVSITLKRVRYDVRSVFSLWK